MKETRKNADRKRQSEELADMINIISIDENQRSEMVNHEIFLDCSEAIERTFYRIVEWEEEAFRDELSLKLMRAIDGAERTGEYGVVTPIGKSCITCLSTGGKLGLILLHYLGTDVKIITDFSRAGDNVWEFLSMNTEITFYMVKQALPYWPWEAENLELTVDGRRYTKDSHMAAMSLMGEWYDELREMTKEKENAAYESYMERSFWTEKIYRGLKEEMAFSEFIEAVDSRFFSPYEKEEEDYALVCEYRVMNYLAYLPEDLFYRKLPLYCIGNIGENREFTKSLTCKNPTFLEALVYDIFFGELWLEGATRVRFQSRYDEYFVLVVSCNESCDISEYPKLAAFGVVVNKKDKTVVICDGRQGVEEFHRRYQNVFTGGQ